MNILKNSLAVLGLPVYLLVVICVSGFIILGFALSINSMTEDSQVDLVRCEIDSIISEAENMYEYADSGSLVTVKVIFPDSLSFVVFGSMAVDGVSRPSDYSLDENLSNNYFFVMDDGTIRSFSSSVCFCGKSTDDFALFGAGSYTLKLELVKEDGMCFVKVYS